MVSYYFTLLASEYLNSKEVSTMYFLICWGLFISKIALLQYMCVGRLGSLVEKLKFSIKDPPKKVIVSRISFLGWSLMENFSFSFKDPPKNQYVIRITFLGGSLVLKMQFLLIKCPKQIRKYIVDTSVLLKYSLANNGRSQKKIHRTGFFTTILLFLLYVLVGKFPSIYKYIYWLI